MQLHWMDISIIGLYLVSTILVGFWVKQRASKNLDSYFLGGKQLSWFVLGISQAAGCFDITGTMWLVYLVFVYGLKSIYIPWIYPMFLHIFYMVYMAKWVRRSNVLTGAEWIRTRFGKNKGAELSQISIVIFAMVSAIGMIAYAFEGIGKFAAVFLPWDLSPDLYAIIIMGITTIYTILGGFHSVALSALIQFILMSISAVSIAVIAMVKVNPAMLNQVIPEGWRDVSIPWKLDLDWSGLIETANAKIAADGYSFFAFFLMMMLIKGFLVSAAGPTPNFDMQRILATRNPKEAAYSYGIFSPLLLFPRYLMVAGIAVLGLVFYSADLNAMGNLLDFEMVLPLVISDFIPVGLLGLLLAGLLAAFMSTFAATINAGAAYLVNDVYKKYIKPNASNREYVAAGYVTTLLILVLGIFVGFFISSINQITQWVFAALWGGYIAANVLKWYWWRLNGYGYFGGMISGIAAALASPFLFPNILPIYAFPFIILVSGIGSVAGSLLTSVDMDILKSFYIQVRPWGFWRPVHEEIVQRDPSIQPNRDFIRDMLNVIIGIIWQTALTAVPIYIVIKDMLALPIALVVVGLTSMFLKRNWLDTLKDT